MVNASDPLRHSVIVGVLCLERELQQLSLRASNQPVTIACQSTIGSQIAQCGITVANQAQTNIVVFGGRGRRAKNCTYKGIIEVRRARIELRLFKRIKTVVVPRRLAKYCK